MTIQKLEIKPKAAKNAFLAAIGCSIFTLIGLMMIFTGKEVFAGILAVIFFGGGLYAIPKILKRKVSIVLTDTGVEQYYAEGTAFIPWRDIEKIGVVSMYSNKMAGIRLNSYDNYLNEMSPALAAYMEKNLPYLKLMTRATTFLDIPAAVTLWSNLEGHDPKEVLESFGKVGNLVEALLWARNKYGYEIILSWTDIDRPAKEFVSLLEEYHQKSV